MESLHIKCPRCWRGALKYKRYGKDIKALCRSRECRWSLYMIRAAGLNKYDLGEVVIKFIERHPDKPSGHSVIVQVKTINVEKDTMKKGKEIEEPKFQKLNVSALEIGGPSGVELKKSGKAKRVTQPRAEKSPLGVVYTINAARNTYAAVFRFTWKFMEKVQWALGLELAFKFTEIDGIMGVVMGPEEGGWAISDNKLGCASVRFSIKPGHPWPMVNGPIMDIKDLREDGWILLRLPQEGDPGVVPYVRQGQKKKKEVEKKPPPPVMLLKTPDGNNLWTPGPRA